MFKKITLVLFALVILTGCETTTAPTVKQTVPASANQTNVFPSTPASGKLIQNPEISDYDQAAYDGAIKLNDVYYCQQIVNADLKAQCLTQVQASSQNDTAAAKTVDCNTLTNQDEKATCELKRQIDEQIKQKDSDEQKKIADDAALLKELIQSGDLSKCKSLVIDSDRFDCEMNILIPKAIAAKDKSICQQASTPEITKACENSAIIK